MRTPIRDYLPLLKEAIEEARAAGLGAAVDELDQASSAVCTTSSEMLQEHGLAIKRFLASTRHNLPASIRVKLKACLNETALASTGWGQLIARLRRSKTLG